MKNLTVCNTTHTVGENMTNLMLKKYIKIYATKYIGLYYLRRFLMCKYSTF